eukprot:196604_1
MCTYVVQLSMHIVLEIEVMSSMVVARVECFVDMVVLFAEYVTVSKICWIVTGIVPVIGVYITSDNIVIRASCKYVYVLWNYCRSYFIRIQCKKNIIQSINMANSNGTLFNELLDVFEWNESSHYVYKK